MGSSARARYQRLHEQGGARLDDPADAAAAIARDEFAQIRLEMFHALGDASRFLVVELLRRHGPLASTELEVALGVSSSTMSHHLRVLESARLVVPDRAGGWTFWRVVAYPVVEVEVPA